MSVSDPDNVAPRVSESPSRRSTWDRTPAEIWGQIFSIGLPFPSATDISDFESSTRQYQVSITSVCSAWRTLAESTPGLWRVIIVGRSFAFEDDMLRKLNDRTAGRPIQLVVESSHANRELVERLLQRTAHLFVIHSELLPEVVNLGIRVAPLLRELRYYCAGVPSAVDVPWLFKNPRMSPLGPDHSLALEVLELKSTPSSTVGWDLQCLSPTLRKLSVDNVGLLPNRDGDVLRAFSDSFPNLEYLEVGGLHAGNLTTYFPPYLRTLIMSGTCPDAPPLWFPSGLVHLSVALRETAYPREWFDYDAPPPLNTLRTLELFLDPWTAKDKVNRLLCRAPELRALDTSWQCLSELFSSSLSASPLPSFEPGPLPPHLKLLRIRVHRIDFGQDFHWLHPRREDDEEEEYDDEEDEKVEREEFFHFLETMRRFLNRQSRAPSGERLAVEWWLDGDGYYDSTDSDREAEEYWEDLQILEERLDEWEPSGDAPWYRLGTQAESLYLAGYSFARTAEDRESYRHFAPAPPPLSTLSWTEF